MNQNAMLRPALIGGILLGVLSAIPPLNLGNCICCAWIIGGGVLAAHLYIKASPTMVTLGSGFTLGLLTGAIGGAISAVFNIPVQILMRSIFSDYTGQMRQMLGDMPERFSALRDLILSASSARLTPLIVIINLFVNVVLYAIIAMLGGALGVALFEKRKAEPPIPPYQPPPTELPPPPPPPPSQDAPL